jgi:hypothetical protein
MQPHGAQWKPIPQPLRTKVMDAAGCGRTDEIGEAWALIENADASTPQAKTNDNLPNIERTPSLAGYLGTLRCAVGRKHTPTIFVKEQAVSPGFYLRMVDFAWVSREDARAPSKA